MTEFYFQGVLGPTNLHLSGEDQPHYIQSELTFGVKVPFWSHPVHLGFVGEGSGSFLSGDDDVRGSYRWQGALKAGLHFSLYDIFFLEAKGGFAVNREALNFGRGTPLEKSWGHSWQVQETVGLGYCAPALCAYAIFSPFQEWASNYENEGLLFGIRFFGGKKEGNLKETPQVEKNRPDVIGNFFRIQDGLRSVELAQELSRLRQENVQLRELLNSKPPVQIVPQVVDSVIAGDSLKRVILFVNESGVVPLQKETSRGRILGLRNPDLDQIASYLNSHPAIKIRILGHAHDTGEHNFNLHLSLRRVQAVRDYLVGTGHVNPDQIVELKGLGASSPLPGKTPDDILNRRVEFEVMQ